jgi:hypothetical protein
MTQVAGDQNASTCQCDRQERLVIAIRKVDRPPRWSCDDHGQSIDRVQYVIEARRGESKLRTPHDLFVFLPDGPVDHKLQATGQHRVKDPPWRTGGGKQAGNEDVRIEDNPHPAA